MPKVSVGTFTEKNARFVFNVKGGLARNGKNYKDLMKRCGIKSSSTISKRYRDPGSIPVSELRGFIKEASLSESDVLDFLYEGKYV
nr:hypothetical protein [Frisingicoccus sp.]